MSDFPPHVEIPEDVVSEVLDGRAVLLNLKTGTYFSLNETGTRLWELLGEDGSVERARRALLDEFRVEPEVLDADLRSVLSELVARSLLTPKPRP